MDIEKLNALFNDGTLTELYQAGFISPKVFINREIYLWIDAQIKSRGIGKNKAVLEAEVKFEKDERTIWRILDSFS